MSDTDVVDGLVFRDPGDKRLPDLGRPVQSPDPSTQPRRIGASQVAGILGLSPWQSPWSVWAKLVGLPVPEPTNQGRLDAGTDAEAFLRAQFNRYHRWTVGLEVVGLEVFEWQAELGDDRWPWLVGHADGWVEDETGERVAGWEGKTSGDLAPWPDVPDYYEAQVQTYMLLTGLSEWWVTVGFAGWKVRHYAVLADPEAQAMIVERTRRFWEDHVITGIAPDVDGSDATTDAIRAVYNTADPDDILYADNDHALQGWVELLRVAKADTKAAEKREAELENRIKLRMADCAVLQVDGRALVTWKSQSTTRVDLDGLRAVAPELVAEHTHRSTSRRFLLKAPKEQT